jgi:signal transduction histidine kinase
VARSGALQRAGPPIVVGLALVLAGITVGYGWIVARHLSDDARQTSGLLGRVFAGLNDPYPDAATDALLDLARQVRSLGIPIVVTDMAGHITALDNAPPVVGADTARLRAWIAELDAENTPVVQPGVGTIHYGRGPAARRLAGLALLEGAVLLCLALLGTWAYRSQVAAARDRLWVAMARESAHQLGTPLMSLTGWIAYLRENPQTTGAELAEHLQADAERLERVAKRFERIGRPARREPVGLGAVAERVVSYFRPRLPTLASPVALALRATGPGPTALGDPVLVEWALEAVIKNAIDALSGRGGRIDVTVEASGRAARVSVRDDGPGVAPEVRTKLFEPGVSTKPGGWGIGLALARRIVEQQHGGRLTYRPVALGPGAEFVLEFPLVRERDGGRGARPGAGAGAGERTPS